MQATQPRLSFWQIWNVSFGFLGVQFGFALQNANVSRILLRGRSSLVISILACCANHGVNRSANCWFSI